MYTFRCVFHVLNKQMYRIYWNQLSHPHLSLALSLPISHSLRLVTSICIFASRLWSHTLWLLSHHILHFVCTEEFWFFFEKKDRHTQFNVMLRRWSCMRNLFGMEKKSAPFSLTSNAFTAYWCKFINYIETNFALYVFKINSTTYYCAIELTFLCGKCLCDPIPFNQFTPMTI